MATVYLAEDLKHERKVALKVLKQELAAVVGAERFLAEIKTTANLQHPHILPLHDSGEADGFLYYVMPYIEGETLSDRIDREKQLPVDEAVGIATAVAHALQMAHEQGIIHRDIKPANILLSRGEPLVADFGIALAVGAAGGSRLTETGLSVGTPYYMSPEQATGDQRVGPPSDTYALACVLYEMLVGEPPYPGATAQAVLGKIISGEAVSATKQRPAIPPNVDAAIRRALEKLPADRFPSAQDFATALADPGFSHGRPAVAGAVESRGAGAWKVAAVVLGISTVALAVSTVRDGPEEPPGVLRYELLLPVEVGANTDFGSNVAISPDGGRIVYSGMEEGAESPGLWVRDRDRLESYELDGTALGVHPTFSPDGTRVAFIGDDRTLKVVSLSGRPPVTLHGGPQLRRGGLSWGDDGYIYFSEGGAQEGGPYTLRRIPENGGDIEIVTAADSSRSEVAHYFPDVLPGSQLVLFSVAREDEYDADTRDIAVANIETGEVHVLLQGIQAVWSESGHILAVRGDGALVSATFDPETLEVGPATPVFEGVQVESLATADFAISDNGTLIYAPGAALDQMARTAMWMDRDGVSTPVDPNWGGRYGDPRLSPDGSQLAVAFTDGGESHVWVKELDAGPQSKLTFQGAVNVRPAWTPDGAEVAFISSRTGNRDVYRRRADAATSAEEVLDVDGVVQEVEYSRDGAWMVVRIGEDIYVQSTDPGSELTPLMAEPAVETSPAISPDGRWIAYASDESGERVVYVRPFPNVNDGKFTVSLRSASSPRWAPDGSELYYKTTDGQFMAAEIISGTTFIVGERTTLFPFRGMVTGNVHAQYDVHPDGDRFLMIQLGDASMTSVLVVIENFTAELDDGSGR